MQKQFMLAVALTALLAGGTPARAMFGASEIDTEKAAVTFHREADRGGYKVVTTDELKKWVDEKRPMLVVDTMPYEASYRKNHIPGAVPFELPIKEDEMAAVVKTKEADFQKLLGPDKDRVIVFYCGFTKCTRSHNGAAWAVKLGYRNVYRQPGGITAWKDAKYPVSEVK